jgi:hypothetical protein
LLWAALRRSRILIRVHLTAKKTNTR